MTNSDAYLSLFGAKYTERKLVLGMKGREKQNSEKKMRGRTGAVLLRASVAEDPSFSWSAMDFVKGKTGRHAPVPGICSKFTILHHLQKDPRCPFLSHHPSSDTDSIDKTRCTPKSLDSKDAPLLQYGWAPLLQYGWASLLQYGWAFFSHHFYL